VLFHQWRRGVVDGCCDGSPLSAICARIIGMQTATPHKQRVTPSSQNDSPNSYPECKIIPLRQQHSQADHYTTMTPQTNENNQHQSQQKKAVQVFTNRNRKSEKLQDQDYIFFI